jgi:sulfoxide reductase catalytic subunit YedY
MLIGTRRGWEISSSKATPEAVVLGRRALLGAGVVATSLAASAEASAQWRIFGNAPTRPAAVLKPLAAKRNEAYAAGRAITGEMEATSYNNYYEFGMSKSVSGAAQALPLDPWVVEIAGLVAKPGVMGFEDLLKKMALEERVYRHRCVETWAMTVPWVGFPLASLLALCEPLASAKYVKFTTLADAKTMPGLGQRFYPWPYTEGLTMAEAANELAFVSVGMYGKTLPPQNGAPLRLTLPWKYGFKSIKSIVRIEFTETRPMSFWEGLQDSEYGFWANVNPAVAHPRWSQASETLLGSDERVPTQIWNGYGEQVAGLYAGLTKERLFV